jgi:hypothetical protein
MEAVYLTCAIVGGTLVVGQFLLSLFGLGHDADAAGHDASFHGDLHHDGDTHGSSWFAGMLSFRAITSALTLFGLCGLAAQSASQAPMDTLFIALLGGVAALVLVAQLMRMLHGLSEEGTVRIARSLGKPATVYLTVPAGKTSAGKVQLRLQNRTVEYQAITAHPEPIATGARVTVVGVVNADTVEVAPEITPTEIAPHVA